MRFHRESRGQSFIEVALALPVILLLVLGVTDLARAFYFSIETSGAARAGLRSAIVLETTDIGDAVRGEPNSAVPNTVEVWGDTGQGQTNADCTSTVGSQRCGDPNGCPPSVFTQSSGVNKGRIACFAVRACRLSNVDYGTCASPGAWNTRPTSTTANTRAIEVVVFYKFTPVTPLIASFLGGSNGFILLRQSATGNELYF